MTSDLASFIDDLSTDPRHHVTKALLDAIAAVWKDETRLGLLTLEFHADREFGAEDSVMTWAAYPSRAREECAEFVRVHLAPAEASELTPESALGFALMNLADAEAGVAKTMKRAAEAQERLDDARQAACSEIEQLNRELAADAE